MRPPERITRREALRRVSILLGGAVAAPTAAALLGGCQADASDGWQPQVLSAEQNDLVTVVSERILPATDTPGAKAAQVNRFIDKLLADWYPVEERERFLEGLAFVDERAQEAHEQPFLELTPDEQTALLSRMDEAAYAPARPGEPAATDEEATGDARDESVEDEAFAQGQGGQTVKEVEEPLRPDSAQADSAQAVSDTAATGAASTSTRSTGTPAPSENAPRSEEEAAFFRRMKELTLAGYYTSEIGATQALRHQMIFSAYQGCVPYEPDDRTWA